MPLVRRLVQGTDFRRFLDFVTPAFFDVMPVRGLVGVATTLVKDYRDRDGFAAALRHRERRIALVGIPLRIASRRPKTARPTPELEADARRAIGQAALELYFEQIFDDAPTLLNLSAERFDHDGERSVWIPGPGHYAWPSEFQSSLRNLYRAFYEEGGLSLEEALDPLDLRPAAGIFLEHFGSGDQRQVEFRVSKFIHAFHEVFVCCKKHGIRLDPAFLALGIYLATLYETLEAVGLPLDVRSAFEKVQRNLS